MWVQRYEQKREVSDTAVIWATRSDILVVAGGGWLWEAAVSLASVVALTLRRS
ncbi:hypothetical protein BS17DRAFT_784032 [Gyrodon lividus]|nr:hypothetical protein BS17DRAFT_784032 [Gyrodon lividus]